MTTNYKKSNDRKKCVQNIAQLTNSKNWGNSNVKYNNNKQNFQYMQLNIKCARKY